MSDFQADAENEPARNFRPDNGPLPSFDSLLKCLTTYLWIRLILPSACGSYDACNAAVNVGLLCNEIVGFCLLNAELAVPKNLLQKLQNRLSQFKTADMTQRVLAMIKDHDADDPQECANAVNRMLPAQNLLGIVVSAEDVTHARFRDAPSSRRATKASATRTENARRTRRGTYVDKHALLAFKIARHYVHASTEVTLQHSFVRDIPAADLCFVCAAEQCCDRPVRCAQEANDRVAVASDLSHLCLRESTSIFAPEVNYANLVPSNTELSQQGETGQSDAAPLACHQVEDLDDLSLFTEQDCNAPIVEGTTEGIISNAGLQETDRQSKAELEERYQVDLDCERDVSQWAVQSAEKVSGRVIVSGPDLCVQDVTDHADNEILLARHEVEEHEEDLVGLIEQGYYVPSFEETTENHTAAGSDLRISEAGYALVPRPLEDTTSYHEPPQQTESRKRKAEHEERYLAYLDCEYYAEQRMNAPEYREGEFHIASVPRTKLTYHDPPSTMTTPCQTQLVTYPVTHTRIPSVCE